MRNVELRIGRYPSVIISLLPLDVSCPVVACDVGWIEDCSPTPMIQSLFGLSSDRSSSL